MNCKRIQEWILTDYIDGQMGDKQLLLVDRHLADCPACQELLSAVRKEVTEPLNYAPKAVPDDFLWSRIKQSIEEQEQHQLEESLMPGFWERLRSAVRIPKPAFALVTVLMMVFMIGPTSQLFMNIQPVKFNGPDQVAYLSSLIDDPAGIAANNGNDSQSPIEQYFL